MRMEKVKKQQISGRQPDHGTEIRKVRGEVVIENNRARILKKHPLDFYREGGVINAEQHRAGEQMMIDYAIGNQNRSILASLAEGRGMINTAEDKMTAKDRYLRVAKLLKHRSYQLLYKVLIKGAYLNEIREEMGWFTEKNTGTDRFREALDDVQEIYDNLRKNSKKQKENINARYDERFR